MAGGGRGVAVAVPSPTVLLRGQERAQTFASSPSSSWEVEKVLLLMDKPQYCLKSRLLIKGSRLKAKLLLKVNRSPKAGAFAAAGGCSLCFFRLELSPEEGQELFLWR